MINKPTNKKTDKQANKETKKRTNERTFVNQTGGDSKVIANVIEGFAVNLELFNVCLGDVRLQQRLAVRHKEQIVQTLYRLQCE
jgi:hypothetical protein